MTTRALLPGTWLSATQKLSRGVWPWMHGVRARLPLHYKMRYVEKHMKQPAPVHYVPDARKYWVDEYGTRHRVQNIPIPIMYPAQADEGLWGGEGIIRGYRKKNNKRNKPRVPFLRKPMLLKRALYSEVLDRWMEITVTRRTLDLIDENHGFDNYILRTHELDLKSLLGMRLKREMLMELTSKSLYPNDAEKKEEIYNKYKQHIIPTEEVDWLGLTLEEAEQKQHELEHEEKLANFKPLKQVYLEELFQKMKEAKLESENEEPESLLSKINPWKKEES